LKLKAPVGLLQSDPSMIFINYGQPMNSRQVALPPQISQVQRRALGLPLAQSLISRNPEISGFVECEPGSVLQGNSLVPAKTTRIGVSNATEWSTSVVRVPPYDPYVSIMILDDIPDTGDQILVRGESSVLPSRQPFRRTDPQASVACAQKRKDLITGKLFSFR
jgi:hypothetical protein